MNLNVKSFKENLKALRFFEVQKGGLIYPKIPGVQALVVNYY